MSVKGTGQRPPLQRMDGVRDLKSLVGPQTTEETKSTQKKSLSKPPRQTESEFKKVKTTESNQQSDPPKPGKLERSPKKTVTFNKKVKVGTIPDDNKAPIMEGKTKKLVKGRKDAPERLGKGERLPGFEGRISRDQNEGVKRNPKKKKVEDGIPEVPKDIKDTFGNLF
jgi:hypothetical protein